MELNRYWQAEHQVLSAGRALESALESGDAFEIRAAAQELLRVGTAREDSMGTVAGFGSVAPGTEAVVDPDIELDQILTELDIAQALLAAGVATNEPGSVAIQPASLTDALDQLETDRRHRAATTPAREGFGAARTDTQPEPALEAFRTSLGTFLDDVVTRTTSVASEATKGLTTLPASVVQPYIGFAVTALGEIPAVGALARMGLRAMRRAVNALRQLIPEALRDKISEYAKKWWDESGVQGTARRFLAVDEVEQRATEVLGGTIEDARLREATDAVVALSARHEKATNTIERVLKVLSALLGPLATSFAAAAAWLYGAAAAGFVAALSGALWLGRDCLDTGAGWERLEGVQVIIGGLTT